MTIPDDVIPGGSPVLQEATRELEAAIHDARVAFDCIALGELDRAHTSAVTARIAIDAALTAILAASPPMSSPTQPLLSSPTPPLISDLSR